jgi:hypothetical protein
MQESPLAGEDSCDKDADWLGDGQQDQEVNKDLQKAIGCHRELLKTAPDEARRKSGTRTGK